MNSGLHPSLSVGVARCAAMGKRDESDEAYVVGLCNQVLGETALTRHKFDWLLGIPGRVVGVPDFWWMPTGPAISS
jgi:hypothetical protein